MVPRRQLAGTAASLVVTVALLVGCGASETSPASDTADATSPASQPTSGGTAPDSNDTAPALQFTAPLVGGGEFDAAALAGSPVAFWFWAPT